MSEKYHFPEGLYSDIRIEESYSTTMSMFNGELTRDFARPEIGAMIRVYDGKLWYTTSTNDLSEIQKELDALAELATPDPAIYENPAIRLLEVNRDERLVYEGENKLCNITRERFMKVLNHYVEKCVDASVPEVSSWSIGVGGEYQKKSFYSSKGSAIVYDYQMCSCGIFYAITVDGQQINGGRQYFGVTPEEMFGHENEALAERDRYIDYLKNAVELEPGEYTCVLSPITTAMFAHESFGHKSEADFMLNDQKLRDEWVLGKKVGSDLVSICDDGALVQHGYIPYDDEGTKARATWLIKDGVLTGRLHDSTSAAALSEELTGNCRAQDYFRRPVVRMTNTYMAGGKDSFEDIIADTKDGIYVYMVSDGTGSATFVMNATVCYRIRDGKICEPIRVRMLSGSVFQTLFDIDRVGSDFEIFDTYTCGKMGQTVRVSAGGPTIRVRKLQVG
ncbi:MAG: TldD/PmbA family protein [Lachnospiraceae bacterium]|nr:TldD/PmbA family protein [Lachnospiraceae bacterium]